MDKLELIERIESLKNIFGNKNEYIKIDMVVELISELDEPKKVKVPQFVADWYEENKDSFDYNLWEYLTDWEKQEPSDFKNWINDENNAFQTLVNMHQFGYEVEKEKRYLVKVKGVSGYGRYLNKALLSKEYFFASENEVNGYRTKHTRKELEEANFGWVFDCPGIEVEEVE